jgi:Tol biopolymer transport system component
MNRIAGSFPRWPAHLLVAGILVCAAAPVEAQYFGRNTVQYRTFDFRILQTQHFDIYHYPESEEVGRDVARMAERWYDRLSRTLDYRFDARQPIILFGNHPELQQTNITAIGEGTQAVTEFLKLRIVMPLLGSYQDTDHLLGHEMVHAFQLEIAGFGRGGGGLESALRRFAVPLWFVEGMAEYLSIGPVHAQTAMWMRDAALSGEIPSIERMTYDPRVFPYRWGHAFWAYVGGRWGDAVIGQILKQVGQGVPYPEAFQRILNLSLEELSEDWHVSIRRAYLPLMEGRLEAREQARPVITQRTRGGRWNLAPSVSPDGRYFAFLSELGMLDIELFLADAESGEVIRRLVRGTAVDPHFGSLRFITSSGTWSPDSRRFAFTALRGAGDVLVVLDVERGRNLKEYRVDGVSELTNPTWSPDGQSVVLAGTRGGKSNLYRLELASGTSRMITEGRWADLQPAFSPDGGRIAFVTERGEGIDFDALDFGGYRIALLDPATGAIEVVPHTESGINSNPAWGRDGRSLYFISDRNGIANVYRVELETGALYQVTNLFSGVAGISELSPALTSALHSDRILFTAYERGGYNIYAIDTAERLAGTLLEPLDPALAVADTVVPAPALLPPHPRPVEPAFNRVAAYIQDAASGLPSAAAGEEYAIVEYRPRLTLDYIGQPQIGYQAGGMFGRSGLYGGVAMIFSDMLGNHTVFGAVEASGQIDEIGFQTIYLYRRHRWNFGVGAERTPWIGLLQPFEIPDDEPGAMTVVFPRIRYFDSALSGLAQYPFSSVQRAEFSAGGRRIAQDIRGDQVRYHVATGQIIEHRPYQEDGFAFNLGEASAALVYDNALFGFTSPFIGQRYRFAVQQTVGDLSYTQTLADYRRYLFMRPFTLAARGFQFGRFGRDGEGVFRDLYLGMPFLMRGYGVRDVAEACRQYYPLNHREAPPEACAVYEDLFGSRVGVVNAELRFPLIRQLVLGFAPIGLPPIEGFLFGDAGLAWSESSSPVFQRGVQQPHPDALNQWDRTQRGIFTSVGAGARVNLFGYFILEASYVNPLDRPRGWHWQFALQPGF